MADHPVSRFTRRLALAALATAAFGTQASEGRWTYEVTVTNITYNQRFTPLLLATHKPTITFFTLGEPAIAPLVTLAEEGNIAPLRALLDGSPLVNATASAAGLLDPGKSVTFQIVGNPPDEADNHLIELAVAAQADAIVTRNVRDVARGELKFPTLKVLTAEHCLEAFPCPP